MHVISKKKLKEFWEEHPDSRNPLEAWFKILKGTKYKTLNELKKTFSSADKVGNKIVFDIGGDRYRLIAVIHFDRSKVFVRSVLTHKEYDKGKWKNG